MTNPESPPQWPELSPSEWIPAQQLAIGVMRPTPDAEPQGVSITMIVNSTLRQALNLPPLNIAVVMDVDYATEIQRQIGEVIMLVRVAQAAGEA